MNGTRETCFYNIHKNVYFIKNKRSYLKDINCMNMCKIITSFSTEVNMNLRPNTSTKKKNFEP